MLILQCLLSIEQCNRSPLRDYKLQKRVWVCILNLKRTDRKAICVSHVHFVLFSKVILISFPCFRLFEILFEVKSLKRYLTKYIGVSRFRQRLLVRGCSQCLEDDCILKPPLELELVMLRLVSTQNMEFISACAGNRLEAVEKYLQSPQDPDVTDTNGRRAIHFASANGHEECVRLLVEAGAEKEPADKVCGATPLHLACLAGRAKMVRLLLELGSDTDVVTKEDDSTPLHWVVETKQGSLEVLRLLLEAGAKTQKLKKDDFAAIHITAFLGHLEMLQVLLEFAADIHQVSGSGETALHLAAQEGHAEVVRCLLEAGAEKDCIMATGATSLHLASESGHHHVVELLLSFGADRHKATEGGATALYLATQHGHMEVVKLLQPTAKRKGPELSCDARKRHMTIDRAEQQGEGCHFDTADKC